MRRMAIPGFPTTAQPAILNSVAADYTRRRQAIIEQVPADLKKSAHAIAYFCANAARLGGTVMAFNSPAPLRH